jgi:hypothetical protein
VHRSPPISGSQALSDTPVIKIPCSSSLPAPSFVPNAAVAVEVAGSPPISGSQATSDPHAIKISNSNLPDPSSSSKDCWPLS